MSSKAKGQFDGNVVTRWEFDKGSADRVMTLAEAFSFTDIDGETWTAHSGNAINGASIPKFFWGRIGFDSPYIGDYRRATALHDSLYLDHHNKNLSKEQDHQRRCDDVMLQAMIADDTDPEVRVMIFLAVRLFGSFFWNKKAKLFKNGDIEKLDKAIADAEDANLQEVPDSYYDYSFKGPDLYAGTRYEVARLNDIADKYKETGE